MINKKTNPCKILFDPFSSFLFGNLILLSLFLFVDVIFSLPCFLYVCFVFFPSLKFNKTILTTR
ncbi:uncharacterized protein FA14DRAFT_25660 [Meira miltonrushii]|uniref:Uncharacterized protein n=1 Tax=Meira miltonrushii TaxID=1280837 RepID=A0A316VPG8_9BASI|nr:uncharacterized protein FA14DRAFT_25660 [Meira miltonrushii]PWN38313.1 hypothetical protein FA14DRAFT_25660 [Meira miltonrushii]